MFIIFATKPLNDRTKGFRFNFLGKKGLVRIRKTKSRGVRIEQQASMSVLHLGKASVYVERKANTATPRRFWHFAG